MAHARVPQLREQLGGPLRHDQQAPERLLDLPQHGTEEVRVPEPGGHLSAQHVGTAVVLEHVQLIAPTQVYPEVQQVTDRNK